VYLVNCSKLELEKTIDALHSENQTLQLEVDVTSNFLTTISQRKSLWDDQWVIAARKTLLVLMS